MPDELKPCKCGGKSWLTVGYAVYLFECEKCGEYMVSQHPLEDAIAAWNKWVTEGAANDS